MRFSVLTRAWSRARSPVLLKLGTTRAASTTSTNVAQKKEGDISNAFASLSGMQFKPLDARFAEVKAGLMAGHQDALQASWTRLLLSLQEDIALIAQLRSSIIPEINFSDIGDPSSNFRAEFRKRGVAVIRNVLPHREALGLKDELKSYIKANPQTKAFPSDNPQVFELYWSQSQITARSHPNMINAQRFLMGFWHSRDPEALVSSSHPTIYADRLRMRLPGDNKFALGPHVDGGSCERWEPEGYGRGGVYDKIFQGKWEEYDAWESSCRLPVVSDLYNGVGACSMFRMFQGWLSLSETGPHEGTLLVNPLLGRATAYFLLRPFFTPQSRAKEPGNTDEQFLRPENWVFEPSPSSWMQGATPGHGQELRDELHPHLRLSESMVHIPRVNPGGYVAWHCDTIHAVDSVHKGQSDSSVMYIPACPLTENNASFLARQRQSFLDGTPSPDFGGGIGESQHVGRTSVADVARVGGNEGMRAFGLLPWTDHNQHLTSGQSRLLAKANELLGFTK